MFDIDVIRQRSAITVTHCLIRDTHDKTSILKRNSFHGEVSITVTGYLRVHSELGAVRYGDADF